MTVPAYLHYSHRAHHHQHHDHLALFAATCNITKVSISITEWGKEISWKIQDVGHNVEDTVLCEAPLGTYSGGRSTAEQGTVDCCMPMGSKYKVVCIDSGEDGWHGSSLTVGTRTFCTSFLWGAEKIEQMTIPHLPGLLSLCAVASFIIVYAMCVSVPAQLSLALASSTIFLLEGKCPEQSAMMLVPEYSASSASSVKGGDAIGSPPSAHSYGV